jgi:hypothetical protein
MKDVMNEFYHENHLEELRSGHGVEFRQRDQIF